MTETKNLYRPSIIHWTLFSLLGGVLGALNPAWFLLKPSHIESIQERFDFDYTGYAMGTSGFFLFLLFIPCLLSTAILFPWFYGEIVQKIKSGNTGFLNMLSAGFFFGCIASVLTALIFFLYAVMFNFFKNHDLMDVATGFALSIPAAGFLGLFGIIISLPAMLATGTLFAYLTKRAAITSTTP